MLILLDVDNVVADLTVAALQEVGSTLTADQITTYGQLAKVPGVIELFAKEEFWAALPVMPGATDGVKHLRRFGTILWVSSPWWTCAGWLRARTHWLVHHFGAAPDDLISARAKWAVHGDLFIDDHPDHVRSWRHGIGYLFDQPHNQDVTDLPRVTWDSIVTTTMQANPTAA